MSKKVPVHFFTVILAAWLLAFTVVSVGFYEDETAIENASVITKYHSSNPGYLAAEPCEEKEVRDAANELPVVFTSVKLDARSGTANTSLNCWLGLYSVSSFGNTTNLPLYLAKKSFLI
jgi:hypothetical protein